MDQCRFSYRAEPLEFDLYEELREQFDPDHEPAIIPNDELVFIHPIAEIVEDVHLLEYGILPDAGGWRDQDEGWAQDVRLYMQVRSRILWERAQELKTTGAGGGGKDPIDALFEGVNDEGQPLDWNAFTRG